MATITTISGGNYKQTPRRTYITTDVYDTKIFKLLKTANPVTRTVTYSLASVDGASPTTCPKGAYLVENGKKIFPGEYNTINGYYVGVFDENSRIGGYIDPNDTVFSVFNTDKPYGLYNTLGETIEAAENKKAPPIYTGGNLLAGGNLDVSGNAIIHGNLQVLSTISFNNNTNITVASLSTSIINGINGNLTITGNITMNDLLVNNNITSYTMNLTTVSTQNVYTEYLKTTNLDTTNINTTGYGGFRQIILPSVQNITQSGTNTLTLNCSAGTYFTITINSNSNFTLNAINVSTGYMVYVFFNNTGAFSPTITFGSGICALFSGGTEQTLAIVASKNATMQFLAYTTNLNEVSRTIVNTS